MDFSLAIGVYLLGAVSGALVVLAAMTDRPTSLEEIRDLRALLAFERFSYDLLAARIEHYEADDEESRKIPWRESA